MEDVDAMTAGMTWASRRVLVTGATGMIGSWLVKSLLERGALVTALVRDADPQSELYRSGDLNRVAVANGDLIQFPDVERAINEHEVETVFHLGAQTIVGTAHRSPLPTFESNIRGTYNVLEACRIHPDLVRCVVIASSDKAYGEHPDLPYREEMPLQGVYPYEVSKSCADLISQSYYRTYQLPVAIVRCGNVYGGGDLNWSRVVPGTIRSVLRGEAPVIRSDGTYVRDYIYVRDVCEAYLGVASAIDRVAGEAFNFSDERGVTVREIVDVILRTMGRSDLQPVVMNTVRGEIREQILSAAKSRKLLSWTPKYDLQAGVTETVRWYEAFCASAV